VQQQLLDILGQLEHAQARLDMLADATGDNRWNVRNDPAKWSVAECVAHLNLTSAAYIPRIRKAIESARQLPPYDGKYHRDLIGWVFGKMTGPLPKIGGTRIGRVKTTAPFVPAGDHPKQITLPEFKRLQLELMGLVKESNGLAIHKTRIHSPFGEKISYNTYSTFRILPPHEERHLQQAEGVWQ
jgi:hypothetical protein